MASSLPDDKRDQFRKALVYLGMRAAVGQFDSAALDFASLVQAAGSNMIDKIRPVLHGRTGAEIIALADDGRARDAERQLARIDQQLATLEAELLAAGKAEAEASLVLDAINLDEAQYRWVKSMFRTEPEVAFKITNNSTVAIAKIGVNGVLSTPNRSVPWVVDDFTYSLPGGLEPGESKDLSLAPGRFGKWASRELEERKDLTLSLKLTHMTAADGKEIGGSSDRDRSRAEANIKRLQEQRAQYLH